MPILIWTTHKLADGAVMIRVEFEFIHEGESYPVTMRYCQALHPFALDEMYDPAAAFWGVIASMTYFAQQGAASSQTPIPSRTCAFERHHLQGTGG